MSTRYFFSISYVICRTVDSGKSLTRCVALNCKNMYMHNTPPFIHKEPPHTTLLPQTIKVYSPAGVLLVVRCACLAFVSITTINTKLPGFTGALVDEAIFHTGRFMNTDLYTGVYRTDNVSQFPACLVAIAWLAKTANIPGLTFAVQVEKNVLSKRQELVAHMDVYISWSNRFGQKDCLISMWNETLWRLIPHNVLTTTYWLKSLPQPILFSIVCYYV